ncbi:MAG TPA: metal ABC transporter permease [Vicinamibacterales bacterium]
MGAEAMLVATAAAAAAGLVGCFAVMRRMVLAGDALSHVALPGIGIALALHVHPLFGALAMLFFGALLVWTLEDRTRVATETVVGVVFSAALALGSMLASGEDLLEALLGRPGALSGPEAIFGLVATAVVITFVLARKHHLVVALVSRDIARTAGINVRWLDFLYLEAFALTVALGLRYLGVLLMGSLIIIPAATAKRLSRNLTTMLVLAGALGAGATALGLILSGWMHREPGPTIVVISAAIFVATTIRRPA